MKRNELDNGLTIIDCRRKTDTVAIELCAKVGSIDEDRKFLGISHFIEHMLFEGTKKRDARQIASEIEGVGGEFGAFTSHERTCFYIKVLKKHIDKAVDVLSDILLNSNFSEFNVEKERKVILSEIKMRHDEPRMYQWELFQKTLFKKHPMKYPVIGYKESLEEISRTDILDFYKKHYSPNNLIISIVGNTEGVAKMIQNSLKKMNFCSNIGKIDFKEPEPTKVEITLEKREIAHSYMVLGYKTVKRDHKDSYALDVIRGVLGKSLSGRLFNEIRIKRGLAYDIGVYNDIGVNYGFFAVYLSTEKKNLEQCKKIILSEFKKLDNLDDKELEEAKNFIEGEYILDNEDHQKMADTLCLWEYASDPKLGEDYINKIRNVSKEEILKARDKYLHDRYAIALIEEK